jgi:hypothetical protein
MTPETLIAEVERLYAGGDTAGALELVERELTDELDDSMDRHQRSRLHATMHLVHESLGVDAVDRIQRQIHAASA